MKGVLATPGTVLLQLKTALELLLVLVGVVINLVAARTLHLNEIVLGHRIES
jgi:hypothetical protein